MGVLMDCLLRGPDKMNAEQAHDLRERLLEQLWGRR